MYEKNTTGTAGYIYGPTGRLAKRTTIDSESHTFYYHKDHLGSTRLVTDESKTIVTDATYEPFGETTVTSEESYLYTGKEKDSTGVSYYGARYYDPETGRFLSRDALAGTKSAPQTLNRYSYCLNNPVKFVDPTGLCVERMCNVDTGVCITYYCNYKKDGIQWTAYNANGEKITDSAEIEKLMNSENPVDRARAVYLMLLMTHPEIEGDPNQEEIPMTEGYRYEVSIEGEKAYVWIVLSDAFESAEGHYAETFLMGWKEDDGTIVDMVRLTVYKATFQSIAWFYHVIGHEGVHVYEYVLLGTTYEYNAYMWNLRHVYHYPFPFPLGRRRLEDLIRISALELPVF